MSESEWRPIATAPKDGTHILAYAPDDEPENVSVYWIVFPNWSGWSYADELIGDVTPIGCALTHWMPIPHPPKEPA